MVPLQAWAAPLKSMRCAWGFLCVLCSGVPLCPACGRGRPQLLCLAGNLPSEKMAQKPHRPSSHAGLGPTTWGLQSRELAVGGQWPCHYRGLASSPPLLYLGLPLPTPTSGQESGGASCGAAGAGVP